MGSPKTARERTVEACERAERYKAGAFTKAFAYHFSAVIGQFMDERDEAKRFASKCSRVRNNAATSTAAAKMLKGWAERKPQVIAEGKDLYFKAGCSLGTSYWASLEAACLPDSQQDGAEGLLESGIAFAKQRGEEFYLSQLYLQRAKLVEAQAPATADHSFTEALRVAQRQSAHGWAEVIAERLVQLRTRQLGSAKATLQSTKERRRAD